MPEPLNLAAGPTPAATLPHSMNPPDLSRLLAARESNDLHAAFMAANAPRFDAYRTRHEDGTAPRAVSAFQLFQTPATVAARMVGLADPRPGLDWLEPSAGLGRILRPILATSPGTVTVCEESPDCAGELFREFPTVTLWQGDFLTRQPTPAFDRVVMNPPFHLRADIRHTLHALQFLRPGGVLVGLCMLTRHREDAIRPLADHWETLPPETFAREGTRVETAMFRIRKA